MCAGFPSQTDDTLDILYKGKAKLSLPVRDETGKITAWENKATGQISIRKAKTEGAKPFIALYTESVSLLARRPQRRGLGKEAGPGHAAHTARTPPQSTHTVACLMPMHVLSECNNQPSNQPTLPSMSCGTCARAGPQRLHGDHPQDDEGGGGRQDDGLHPGRQLDASGERLPRAAMKWAGWWAGWHRLIAGLAFLHGAPSARPRGAPLMIPTTAVCLAVTPWRCLCAIVRGHT